MHWVHIQRQPAAVRHIRRCRCPLSSSKNAVTTDRDTNKTWRSNGRPPTKRPGDGRRSGGVPLSSARRIPGSGGVTLPGPQVREIAGAWKGWTSGPMRPRVSPTALICVLGKPNWRSFAPTEVVLPNQSLRRNLFILLTPHYATHLISTSNSTNVSCSSRL